MSMFWKKVLQEWQKQEWQDSGDGVLLQVLKSLFLSSQEFLKKWFYKAFTKASKA